MKKGFFEFETPGLELRGLKFSKEIVTCKRLEQVGKPQQCSMLVLKNNRLAGLHRIYDQGVESTSGFK